MLFVVAGGTFRSHCLPSMHDFDAICGVPEHLVILLLVVDFDFDVFIVTGSTFGSYCLSSMLDFDAICCD